MFVWTMGICCVVGRSSGCCARFAPSQVPLFCTFLRTLGKKRPRRRTQGSQERTPGASRSEADQKHRDPTARLVCSDTKEHTQHTCERSPTPSLPWPRTPTPSLPCMNTTASHPNIVEGTVCLSSDGKVHAGEAYEKHRDTTSSLPDDTTAPVPGDTTPRLPYSHEGTLHSPGDAEEDAVEDEEENSSDSRRPAVTGRQANKACNFCKMMVSKLSGIVEEHVAVKLCNERENFCRFLYTGYKSLDHYREVNADEPACFDGSGLYKVR